MDNHRSGQVGDNRSVPGRVLRLCVMGVPLYDYQIEAVGKMKNGCVLCGGVGSGKSRTALAYYYIQNGGIIGTDEYVPMDDPPMDLYIITTAHKRDTLEWEGELPPFLLSADSDNDLYLHKVVIDSWNNIGKYTDISGAFFIFDEQRVVGSGAWVKAFLKIAKANQWIMLSATPGDKWEDYIPLFIANGFYKNRTEFIREHIVYSRISKFPKVDRYINTGRLIRLRNKILVNMDFTRPTVSHQIDILCDYDATKYKRVLKERWNIWDDKPLSGSSELCSALRRVVNTDIDRWWNALQIVRKHKRAIIFYNFDYELAILRAVDWFDYETGAEGEIAEWNGHKHQPVPEGEKWVYLVQYTAGCEGWNCVKTDTVIFYSQNYSYKVTVQAMGRIDRLNTPYTDLYYYHLKSKASIDLAISKALKAKKAFNEMKFASGV